MIFYLRNESLKNKQILQLNYVNFSNQRKIDIFSLHAIVTISLSFIATAIFFNSDVDKCKF